MAMMRLSLQSLSVQHLLALSTLHGRLYLHRLYMLEVHNHAVGSKGRLQIADAS